MPRPQKKPKTVASEESKENLPNVLEGVKFENVPKARRTVRKVLDYANVSQNESAVINQPENIKDNEKDNGAVAGSGMLTSVETPKRTSNPLMEEVIEKILGALCVENRTAENVQPDNEVPPVAPEKTVKRGRPLKIKEAVEVEEPLVIKQEIDEDMDNEDPSEAQGFQYDKFALDLDRKELQMDNLAGIEEEDLDLPPDTGDMIEMDDIGYGENSGGNVYQGEKEYPEAGALQGDKSPPRLFKGIKFPGAEREFAFYQRKPESSPDVGTVLSAARGIGTPGRKRTPRASKLTEEVMQASLEYKKRLRPRVSLQEAKPPRVLFPSTPGKVRKPVTFEKSVKVRLRRAKSEEI